jgi:hypothetical protein
MVDRFLKQITNFPVKIRSISKVDFASLPPSLKNTVTAILHNLKLLLLKKYSSKARVASRCKITLFSRVARMNVRIHWN